MDLAISLGGTITGEHGVGRTKKSALPEQLGEGRRFFAVGSQGDIVVLRRGQRPRPRSGGQALVVRQVG